MSSKLRDAHEFVDSDNEAMLQGAIGRQVRKLRQAKNLTVADLSKATSVSVAMVSKVESSLSSPSLATLQRIV